MIGLRASKDFVLTELPMSNYARRVLEAARDSSPPTRSRPAYLHATSSEAVLDMKGVRKSRHALTG